MEARRQVKSEIQDLKEKLQRAKENIGVLKGALADVQRDDFDNSYVKLNEST